MLSYLRTHLFLQLPFRLLNMLPTLMLLSLAILTQSRALAKAKVAKVDFILITMVVLLTPMFMWHYSTLCHVAINEASLVMFEGDRLPDATTVASLAILLTSAGVTQMHRIPGPKVKVVAANAVAIRAMVVVMVLV